MKDGKDKIGQDVGAECIKNKVAPPFGKCSWKFYFDPTRGLDVIESLVEHMLEEGYLPKNASGRVEIGDKKYTKSQIVDMYRDKPLPEIIAALQAIDERRTKVCFSRNRRSVITGRPLDAFIFCLLSPIRKQLGY